MICPRCRGDEDIINTDTEPKEKKIVKMKDIKRKGGFHKQTKYICPECKYKKMVKNK